MNSRRWLQGIRLFGAMLLAPALVPLTLHACLSLVTAQARSDLPDLAAALRVFELTFGVGMVYLCVLCLGVPYIVLVHRAQRLSFRTIMLPALVFAWVYAVVVYFYLQADYAFAGTVAGFCVPGVLLAGLCFYFLAAWRSEPEKIEISPLLETYSGREQAAVQA